MRERRAQVLNSDSQPVHALRQHTVIGAVCCCHRYSYLSMSVLVAAHHAS